MSAVDLSKDICSLTQFKRNTTECVEQMKESGRPMILTVNGKAEIVVQDAESYQKLLDALDHTKVMEGIREGLESVARGEGIPLAQFDAQMRRKYKIPRKA